MCSDGTIQAMIRFSGYFSPCFFYILNEMSEIAHKNGTKITGDIFYENGVQCAALHMVNNTKYKVEMYNCAQVCIDVLLTGEFDDKQRVWDLAMARLLVEPNSMYHSLT